MTTAAQSAIAAAGRNLPDNLARVSESRGELLWELYRNDRALERILRARLITLQSELSIVAYLLGTELTSDFQTRVIHEAGITAHTLQRVIASGATVETERVNLLARNVLEATDRALSAIARRSDPLPAITEALDMVINTLDEG